MVRTRSSAAAENLILPQPMQQQQKGKGKNLPIAQAHGENATGDQCTVNCFHDLDSHERSFAEIAVILEKLPCQRTTVKIVRHGGPSSYRLTIHVAETRNNWTNEPYEDNDSLVQLFEHLHQIMGDYPNHWYGFCVWIGGCCYTYPVHGLTLSVTT